jgi:hypothetical protein
MYLLRIALRTLCQGYLLVLLYWGFREITVNPGLNLGILAIIGAMLVYRRHLAVRPLFVPDLLLFSLPALWSLNILLQTGMAGQWFLAPQVVLLALCLLVSGPGWLASPWGHNSLLLGIWGAAVFALGFPTLVCLLFPGFPPELLQRVLMAGVFFFSTLPLAYTAFAPVSRP